MRGGKDTEVNSTSSTNDNTRRKSTKKCEKGAESAEHADGGWGWMVVLASFMIHVIADGIAYSFGIFYIEFLDYYESGKGETAWIGSLISGVTLTVGPVASILTNKYGCRATTITGSLIASAGFILSLFAPNLYFHYFSIGIIGGLGFGLIYFPAIVSVGYYFEKRRSFAIGLAVSGSGLGTFIFNPLSKYLIEHFGWRGAILIEAGVILNCVLCGLVFRPLEVQHKRKSDTNIKGGISKGSDVEKKRCFKPEIYDSLKEMCDFSLLKDSIFVMFLISNFLTSIGFNIPFIFLTDRALDEGIDKESANWLVSIIGISNTIGRVLFGLLADRMGSNRLILYNIALTICGVATAVAPLCSTYLLLVVYACVFGLFIGVYVSLTSVVLVDLLGIEMLTHSFGLLMLFQGIASLIGPPIAGWLYDGTGSYDVSFIVAGVVIAISGVMLCFIPLNRRCLRKTKSKLPRDDNVMV